MRSRVMMETDCGVSRSERFKPVAVLVDSVVYEPVPSEAPSYFPSTRTVGIVRGASFAAVSAVWAWLAGAVAIQIVAPVQIIKRRMLRTRAAAKNGCSTKLTPYLPWFLVNELSARICPPSILTQMRMIRICYTARSGRLPDQAFSKKEEKEEKRRMWGRDSDSGLARDTTACASPI
jgi:hypothetical protein